MASQQETYSDYGIPIFYDNRNGEMILRDSKTFFNGEHTSSVEVWKDQLLKIRGEVNRDKTFLCGHCKKPIYISGRFNPQPGQKKFHFQHFRSTEVSDCIFHEGKHYSQDEIRRMIFNGQQESAEHKKLKKIIQDCFILVVGQQHVFEEPTLRGNDGGWRRPDIYVELSDKNVVFEVQLTYIFLSVILERNIVHRNNGRFVMWVFKDFGDGDGNTLDSERLSKLDIFAANNYNAFVLDDEAIDETELMGNLHLTVYYRDYYNENGQTKAKLGKALVSFDSLTFDTERKLIYYFDSESKLSNCIKELKRQEEIEEENRRKEKERQDREEERKAKRWEAFGIAKKLFTANGLWESEMQSIIEMAKSDNEFRHQTLEHIYSFTAQHRRDNNSLFSAYYQNSIDFLTALYADFAAIGKPNVMTCLRRCWENLAQIAGFPGGKDYTVDALFSPSLSNLNFKFLDFISSPNHRLTQEQREKIQNWLRDYHKSPSAGKIGKDRYKHFYAWMVLLIDKVKNTKSLDLSMAHKLIRDKYKVIRATLSIGFGFLSGYNDDYKVLSDVANAFKNDFPEYAGVCSLVPVTNRNQRIISELSNVAANHQQKHDLDELIRILFSKSQS